MATPKLLVEVKRNEMDDILNNASLFKFYRNDPIEVCDPYYTPPVANPYTDDIDWDAEYEYYNNYYADEIRADDLRYPLILEMEAKKKEMAENPLIFDKEEEYYETDPHQLVNFDEKFTPFFEQENNETFFNNLKNPLRLKWEEIPEEDRKQKIVHFDQSVRKLKYDEIDLYFTKYLINKDIVLLFIKFIPSIWPISTFLSSFEKYIINKKPKEMYDFFIERVILLGSTYIERDDSVIHTNPNFLTPTQNEVKKYMKTVMLVKNKMFNDLLACIKVKPVKLLFKAQETPEEILAKSEELTQPNTIIEPNLINNFIKYFQLYTPHAKSEITRVYNYPEIAKFIVILNLSFFNIFPIPLDEYEKIRQLNKSLFIHFLWYLKDFFWDFYESPLKIKGDIKSYFTSDEYEKYSKLIEYYPSRMVAAKEYFFLQHNTILREVAVDYLEDYFEKEKERQKAEYRHNADFYLLNQELQGFQKTKEKIYSKFRKLNKTEEETIEAINKAYEHHKRYQAFLSKILFQSSKQKQPKIEQIPDIEPRKSLLFYVDNKETTIVRTYDELITETTNFFIETLKNLGVYEQLCEEHKIEPKKYVNPKIDIYTKLLKKKLIEPNLWNNFDDYCYMAIDKYPDKTTYLSDFYTYQKHFIEEFMRDIMFFWGYGKIIPKEMRPILKTRRRLKHPL
jgi:hypothetical protein